MANSLVIYFSRSGENYFGGELKNIEKGNTEVIAEYIKEGSDLQRISNITETDPNLVAIKCHLLIKQGYDFIPQEYDAVFLK